MLFIWLLSQCVLEGPAKTLDYPTGWEGLSLYLTLALLERGTEGPETPSLRTQPPLHGAAGASPALRGSKHSLLLSPNFQREWQDNSRGAKNSLFNKWCQDIQNRYSHI